MNTSKEQPPDLFKVRSILEKTSGRDTNLLLDPDNGFSRVFRSVRRNIEYSIVVVPAGSNFKVTYIKPSCDIHLTLKTVDPYRWLVTGILDTDTFANLGLQVKALRQRNVPPVVTVEDVAQAQRYGSLEEFGINKEGLTLFAAEIKFSPHMVARFLRRIWKPGINPAYSQTRIPVIDVGNSYYADRSLPQKGPVARQRSTDAIIKVHSRPF